MRMSAREIARPSGSNRVKIRELRLEIHAGCSLGRQLIVIPPTASVNFVK